MSSLFAIFDIIGSVTGLSSILGNEMLTRIVVMSTIVGLLFIFMRGKTSAPKGDTHVIMGLMGTGKTSLFYQLEQGKSMQTVTSLKGNDEEFVIEALDCKEPVKVYDFPGHASFRYQLPEVLQRACSVTFVIDLKKPDTTESARLLHDILSNSTVVSNRVPVLLAFNKIDLVQSRSSRAKTPTELMEGYVGDLEVRLEALRNSVESLEEFKSSGSDNDRIKIGNDQKFKFAHSRAPVTTGLLCVKDGDVDPVINHLNGALASN